MPKTEGEKLAAWLEKNNFDPAEAKKALRAMRDQRSRSYSTFTHDFSGRRVRLGVLGDTHFGNKWTDKAFLNDVMAHMKKEGVEAVYHTGDFTDGPWQRHRNVLEQYAHGFDAQVLDFVEDFPSIGKPIFGIQGNHDNWYMKQDGGSVGDAIALRRSDFTYLGPDEATVQIGKVNILLSHPDDGSAYAYSYKAQKFLESMVKMGESLPNMIWQGHYHKLFYMHSSGVHFYSTGTTERQTPWMRGKKIAADLGAFILDIHRDSRGNLTKVVSTVLPHNGEKHKPAIR